MTGPAVPSDEELREAIALGVAESRPWNESWETLPERLREQFRITADALLPVVRRYADQRAAEELRAAAAAARGMHDPPAPDCVEWADWLDVRADVLTREATT